MDWIDELFTEVENYDQSPKLREYCFSLWESLEWAERFEEYDYYSRIESADLEELQELLRGLKDRLPEKVREGNANQKEIARFIKDRT